MHPANNVGLYSVISTDYLKKHLFPNVQRLAPRISTFYSPLQFYPPAELMFNEDLEKTLQLSTRLQIHKFQLIISSADSYAQNVGHYITSLKVLTHTLFKLII